MDIFTIKSNLENTIAGKEAMLASLKVKDEVGQYTLRYMLDLNIQELKVILADVEVVANKTINEIYRNG